MRKKKIAIILFGDYLKDGRVQRTAETLYEEYEVKVFVTTEKMEEYPKVFDCVPIQSVPLKTKKLTNHPLMQIIKYIEYFFAIINSIKKYNPDIIFCNDVYTIFFGWFFKKKGTRFVYDSHELWKDTMHNYAYNASLFKVLYWIQKKTIRSADAVITVNNSIAEIMKNDHNIEKPTIIMNIAKNPKLKNGNIIRKQTGISSKTKIVLFVGGITPGRGLENLVESCRYWEENIVLVFLGFGTLIPKLEKMIMENSLLKKVFFLEPVLQSEVSTYIDGCDAGIITYENTCLNHYYALPNKIFQIAGMQKVLLASNFPELEKIINAYNLGLTFDPTKPKAIADAVNSIFNNNFKISEVDYDRFIQNYNWGNERDKLLNMFEDLFK